MLSGVTAQVDPLAKLEANEEAKLPPNDPVKEPAGDRVAVEDVIGPTDDEEVWAAGDEVGAGLAGVVDAVELAGADVAGALGAALIHSQTAFAAEDAASAVGTPQLATTQSKAKDWMDEDCALEH